MVHLQYQPTRDDRWKLIRSGVNHADLRALRDQMVFQGIPALRLRIVSDQMLDDEAESPEYVPFLQREASGGIVVLVLVLFLGGIAVLGALM